jgi:hypothetical protein
MSGRTGKQQHSYLGQRSLGDTEVGQVDLVEAISRLVSMFAL